MRLVSSLFLFPSCSVTGVCAVNFPSEQLGAIAVAVGRETCAWKQGPPLQSSKHPTSRSVTWPQKARKLVFCLFLPTFRFAGLGFETFGCCWHVGRYLAVGTQFPAGLPRCWDWDAAGTDASGIRQVYLGMCLEEKD